VKWIALTPSVVPPMRLAWTAGNLVAIAWCFGAASLALASRSRERTRAAGTIALMAVVLYLLQFGAAAWDPLRPLGRISPFHYYDTMPILLGTVTPTKDIAGLLGATAVLLVVAYSFYSRRDL
jgi:hypothetical protein